MTYPIVDTTNTRTAHPALHNAVIDVKGHFGAAGDGVTDDTAAIQAAINAAGTVVYFPPGTYKISSVLTIANSGTTLRGSGKGTTTIRRADNMNAYMVSLTGKTDCVIEHIKFDANDGNQASVQPQVVTDAQSHNLTVQYCSFTDTKGFCVFVLGGPTSRVNNLRVLFNDMTQRAGGVNDILVPVSEGGCIQGNWIIVQGGVGIVPYEADDLACIGNTIILSGAGGTGIRVSSCRFALVMGNTIVCATNDTAIEVAKETDNPGTARTAIDTYLIGNTLRATTTTGTTAFKLTNDANRVTIADNGAQFFGSFITYNSGSIDHVLITGNRTTEGITFETRTVTPTNVRAADNVAPYASLDVASAATITLGNHSDYFNITGTTTITAVTASYAGRVVTLKFAGILTFTDGSNLMLNGNFVTSADDTITLVSDGTNWYETVRSVN